MIRIFALLAALAALAGCGPEPVTRRTEILVLGDSVMAWNRLTDGAIADVIGRRLGVEVADRSRNGATILGTAGETIPDQYRPGDYEWVILDGGANDLQRRCNCNACQRTLNRLITPDGSGGAIVDLVRRARADGARVLYLGTYRAPTGRRFFQGCDDELDEVDRRVKRLAARDAGVLFVSGKDALDPNNPAHFFLDKLHPSPVGSARLGVLIANAIRVSGGV
ncbi:MAG: SGNH/GDSL hydrolase family protein [Silicimonas sp.]|nr:SGNH/GDSL hydrolase family protein [Silicimonas sp.]NNL36004.1 SGNH/GDSL hydrolase family protein [Silicimonas sp.]